MTLPPDALQKGSALNDLCVLKGGGRIRLSDILAAARQAAAQRLLIFSATNVRISGSSGIVRDRLKRSDLSGR